MSDTSTKTIPYSRQQINQRDIDSVVSVLRSDFLTQGDLIKTFEQNICDYCGVGFAVGTSSATAALHLACLALGLGQGDSVWTSPNTFVASANCALYCGADVDFVDIDPDSFNMCMTSLERKLKKADVENQLPKIIIPVHFAGQSCDMRRLSELSRIYGFRIIEDASHALGASFENEKVGSCRYSDITVFSFHPVKMITTGEGGIAVTNDSKVASTIRDLSSHGITRDITKMENRDSGPWYYEQHSLGMNYRMTEISAALGISQLERLDDFVDSRRKKAAQYDEWLGELPLYPQRKSTNAESSFHIYVVRLSLNSFQQSKEEIFSFLRTIGIGVNVHYIPVHTQPYFRRLGFKTDDFPVSVDYYKAALTLPLFPDLSYDDHSRVVDAIASLQRSA